MTSAYRKTFGVSSRARDLTPHERNRVDREVSAWKEQVRRRAMAGPNQSLAIGLVALVAMVVSLALRFPGVAFSMGSLAGILLFSAFIARKHARATIAAAGGPFKPPPEGWRVEEIDIVARSVVAAASGDEDYTEWWLFEIPGGDWYYFDTVMLAPTFDRIPHETLHIVRLVPYGQTLEATWSGDPIPRHGMRDGNEDAYADAIAAGHVWRPEDPRAFSGSIAASRLPGWVRFE